jgi:hypothetical protein
MHLRRTLLALALTAALPAAAHAEVVRDGSVTADVGAQQISLSNGLVKRVWDRAALASAITDERAGAPVTAKSADFTLTIAGQSLASTDFKVDGATVTPLARGGLRLTMALTSSTLPVLTARRVVEAYPGVAGFRSQTTLFSPVPLLLSAATIDEAAVGTHALPTVHAFRAGDDWREAGWKPSGSIGDDHAGDWRDTRTGTRGAALTAPGEWVTADLGDNRTVFEVMERNDFPSSRALYDGTVATTRVDFTRDVVGLGPFEEQGHIENPADQTAGRARPITSDGLALPAAFTGVGADIDDEAWQFHKYLVEHRIDPFPRDVVFNTDGTDNNVISTGAKDDADLKTIQQIAPTARRMGADVFTLDDGWQAASGDWYPDSPEHREPRGKFPARFPDATFAAVREAIAPMKLGLWMSPMEFNGQSETFKAHPEWGCAPLGDALGAASGQDQDGVVNGSDEAGIGIWSADYIPFLEGRLRDAIANWHVAYFKFDFLTWADCAGVNDIWTMHDDFVAMIDRLRADFPHVAFAIDETNDYRLFPFDSTLRGPTWFTNGGPSVARVLHNTWSLSPWIPAMSIGQKVLTGAQRAGGTPVSTGVAATLLNEQMVTDDLRQPAMATVADEARPWLDWGKAHRDEYLSGVTFPLLDDPADGKRWAALQNWNPDTGRGALLAFRQDDPRDSIKIALRDIPDGHYQLRTAPNDAPAGTVDASELRDGITVTLPARGAQVLTITRVGQP